MIRSTAAALVGDVVRGGTTTGRGAAVVGGVDGLVVGGDEPARAGIVSRCPGWMTLVRVSRLAARRAPMVTLWRWAMPYSESPGRTV